MTVPGCGGYEPPAVAQKSPPYAWATAMTRGSARVLRGVQQARVVEVVGVSVCEGRARPLEPVLGQPPCVFRLRQRAPVEGDLVDQARVAPLDPRVSDCDHGGRPPGAHLPRLVDRTALDAAELLWIVVKCAVAGAGRSELPTPSAVVPVGGAHRGRHRGRVVVRGVVLGVRNAGGLGRPGERSVRGGRLPGGGRIGVGRGRRARCRALRRPRRGRHPVRSGGQWCGGTRGRRSCQLRSSEQARNQRRDRQQRRGGRQIPSRRACSTSCGSCPQIDQPRLSHGRSSCLLRSP